MLSFNIDPKRRLILKKGDITKEEVDAIGNAANSRLAGGGGVDGAIHRAGGPSIMKELDEIRPKIGGYLPTGEAVITGAGDLKAKYVIHAVGPIWRGGSQNEENLLRNAYQNSLKLASQKGVRSIAFPSISTGIYGYPVEKAAPVAIKAVVDFFRDEPSSSIEEVRFVLFDDNTFKAYEVAAKEILG